MLRPSPPDATRTLRLHPDHHAWYIHPDNPDFILDGNDGGMGITHDRGKNWQGPFRLPLFGQKGIAARTDYLVNGKHDCTLFLTA